VKTKIVNLPYNENDKQKILDALLKSYSLTETFELNRNLYKHTVEARKHKDFDSNPAMKTLTISNEQDIAWEMFLLFAVGVKEAILYVAITLTAIGAKANFLYFLTVAIGLKLHDPDIIEVMDGEQPIEQNIQACADKCITKIISSSNALKGKTYLTYQELIGYSKDFDELVKTFDHSYYEYLSSTKKRLAKFVELENNYHVPKIKMSGGEDFNKGCSGSCAIL